MKKNNINTILLAAILTIVFVGGIFVSYLFLNNSVHHGQSSQLEQKAQADPHEKNIAQALAEKEEPSIEEKATLASSSKVAASVEEWCVASKINYIKDPFVSVHSPKLIYVENSVATQAPVITTLSYDDAYNLPLTGKIYLLTTLGVPKQHRITELEFQVRVIHSNGETSYGKPFAVKEINSLLENLVYNVQDEFNINEADTVKFDSKLKYKIDGIERVQCTVQNAVPFINSDSYQLPSVSNIAIGTATPISEPRSNLNAQINISFKYANPEPTFVELHSVSSLNSNAKIYFSGIRLSCTDGTCVDTLTGLINADTKKIFCAKGTTHYLQVNLGSSRKNYLLSIDAHALLKKEFGGCQQ